MKKKTTIKYASSYHGNNNSEIAYALVANEKGEIFDLEGYAATGTNGVSIEPLDIRNTIEMPKGSEVMFLPNRKPILYNLENCQLEVLHENPYEPGKNIMPIAVFNSPGYLLSHTCSYRESQKKNKINLLPLFSYGAVGWYKNSFRSAAILVDSEPRQDLTKMPEEKIIEGIIRMRKLLPKNRIRRHIEKCALTYGCPAGKNFFLNRYEAPLPTSKRCNAQCLGCISLQYDCQIRSSQDRITFTPLAQEIADVALVHINQTKQAIVSFGQGCEGDPLLASKTIINAIRIIRKATNRGTININTNGGIPDNLKKMFAVGLDSVRISINSFRESCYNAYFRPTNYCFKNVLSGIDLAISKKKHVAINYLSCPGFTDSIEEVEALKTFLRRHPINMIQWRNLNFDPLRYISIMNKVSQNNLPIGMLKLINKVRTEFPNINHGYFNPPRKKFYT